MGKKKKNEDYEFQISNSFPNLYHFIVTWKEIDWEPSDGSTLEGLFNPDGVIIKKVAGFTNPGALRKHMNSVFQTDFSSLKKQISSFQKAVQLENLESLLGQAEDIKYSLIGECQLNGNIIKIFKRWTTTTTSPVANTGAERMILQDSESFVSAFLSGFDDIIAKLRYAVAQLEMVDPEENDLLTFKYISRDANPEGLYELFNGLADSGFIIDDRTYVYDFKRIFSGMLLRRKIIWDTHLEDLYWFISYMKRSKLLEDPRKLWIKTCYCFTYKDSKTEIAVKQLSGAHKPSRAKEIEDLVNRTLLLGNTK